MGKIYLSTFVGNINASKREGPDRLQREQNGSFLSIYLTHKELLVTSIINSNPRSNYGASLWVQTLPKQSLGMSKMK